MNKTTTEVRCNKCGEVLAVRDVHPGLDDHCVISIPAHSCQGSNAVVMTERQRDKLANWKPPTPKEFAKMPVDSIGTCMVCGYYGPGPGHDCKGGK